MHSSSNLDRTGKSKGNQLSMWNIRHTIIVISSSSGNYFGSRNSYVFSKMEKQSTERRWAREGLDRGEQKLVLQSNPYAFPTNVGPNTIESQSIPSLEMPIQESGLKTPVPAPPSDSGAQPGLGTTDFLKKSKMSFSPRTTESFQQSPPTSIIITLHPAFGSRTQNHWVLDM